MPIIDDINERLRDFVNWNAQNPLPTGDPTSGVFNPSKNDLRQLFRLDPELVVTNKPEVAVAILTGLGQWDESSKEG